MGAPVPRGVLDQQIACDRTAISAKGWLSMSMKFSQQTLNPANARVRTPA